MKYLLWALVIYFAWRWYQTKTSTNPDADAPAATVDAAGDATAERMVACAQCGIHLPLSEAVRGDGALHYCSEAHRSGHSGG